VELKRFIVQQSTTNYGNKTGGPRISAPAISNRQMLRVTTLQPVKKPVHLGGPCTAVRLVELSLEIVKSVALLFTVNFQRVADVADVVQRLKFRDAARQHHCQQRDEDIGVLPQAQVRFTTQLHEPDIPAPLTITTTVFFTIQRV